MAMLEASETIKHNGGGEREKRRMGALKEDEVLWEKSARRGTIKIEYLAMRGSAEREKVDIG